MFRNRVVSNADWGLNKIGAWVSDYNLCMMRNVSIQLCTDFQYW